MHFGIVAVKVDVARLVEAFSSAWPEFELKLSEQMTGVGTVAEWLQRHEHVVCTKAWSPDNLPVTTFGFWQDGEWAVMLDPGYVQASDEVALARISADLGRVLSFVIETAGGVAAFHAFEHGRLAWCIETLEGHVREQGERPPEAAGLPDDHFYMDAIEQLQRAYGLRPLEDVPGELPTLGRAYIDRTDYSASRTNDVASAPTPPSVPPRPWWKFW